MCSSSIENTYILAHHSSSVGASIGDPFEGAGSFFMSSSSCPDDHAPLITPRTNLRLTKACTKARALRPLTTKASCLDSLPFWTFWVSPATGTVQPPPYH